MDTNPVLEAFGNSKTARNNNSSRFGKYIKLYFEKSSGLVLGAEIKNYLLEKSRVNGGTKKERNYHIYFFMLRGCTDDEATKYGLADGGKRKKPEDFTSMKVYTDLPDKSQKDGSVLTGEQQDVFEWGELVKAFNDLSFTPEEQDAIKRIVAASLHLGDVLVDDKKYDEKKGTPCGIKNMDKMALVAGLLQTDVNELVTELVNKDKIPGIN